MKLLKLLVGLALVPLAASATLTLAALVRDLYAGASGPWPASFWGLAIGFGLWLLLFLAFPRPLRAYVLGHELTHALWAWLMGARVSRLRVGAQGGSVNVSHTNFLITLAPYFFPLYTILVMLAYFTAALFHDQRAYAPLWLGSIGLTWAFHLTFTVDMLRHRQQDIQDQGHVFSYVVIYLLNVLGICLWIVLVAPPTLRQYVEQSRADASRVWQASRALYARAAQAMPAKPEQE